MRSTTLVSTRSGSTVLLCTICHSALACLWPCNTHSLTGLHTPTQPVTKIFQYTKRKKRSTTLTELLEQGVLHSWLARQRKETTFRLSYCGQHMRRRWGVETEHA
jgi:hypothetical protein